MLDAALGLGVLAPSFEKLLTANLVMKFCHRLPSLSSVDGRWNLKSFVRLFGGRGIDISVTNPNEKFTRRNAGLLHVCVAATQNRCRSLLLLFAHRS